MSKTKQPLKSELRLPSQANWLKYIQTQEDPPNAFQSGAEYPFYSDTGVVGEITEGLGPYKILNAVPISDNGTANISMVLRAFIYDSSLNYPLVPLKTDTSRFHGGYFQEEIASLVSLSLGIRLKAGEANRHFYPGDLYGRFRSHAFKPAPSLSIDVANPVIRTSKRVYMRDAEQFLATIPNIEPSKYVDLVRAARAFQDALWIAESDPHLAWLLLVSSLEIAANSHFTASGSALDNFVELKPDLSSIIIDAGGQELLKRVAEDFKGVFGSTKKFLVFCEKFIPNAPDTRPTEEGRITWTWSGMKPLLSKIYDLRSQALHAGIPFPAPMCRPPSKSSQEDHPAEKAIIALAEGTMTANWLPKDAPIALHTFQYFVRGALLNWWQQIPNER